MGNARSRGASRHGQLELVATARDVVSGREFRVLFGPVDRLRPTTRGWSSRFRRRSRTGFVIEQLEPRSVAAVYESWDDVERWHDATLISTGWSLLRPVPGTAADGARARVGPAPAADPDLPRP
jgi:hypothetical protein